MLLVKSKESKNLDKTLYKTGGYAALLVLLSFSSAVNAAPSITNPTSVLSIFLSLLVVVGVIFAVAFVMRRFNVASVGNQQLSVVASLNAGTREKILVLQVGDEQHLIGVTAQNINHLSKLDKPLASSSPSPSGADFKQKLVQAMAQKINPAVKDTTK